MRAVALVVAVCCACASSSAPPPSPSPASMTSDDIVHTPRGIVFAPASDGVWMPYPALRDMLAGAVEDQRPLRVALAHSETLARFAEQERDEQASRARDLAGKLTWVPGVAFVVGAVVSAALVLGGLLASRTLATPSP